MTVECISYRYYKVIDFDANIVNYAHANNSYWYCTCSLYKGTALTPVCRDGSHQEGCAHANAAGEFEIKRERERC